MVSKGAKFVIALATVMFVGLMYRGITNPTFTIDSVQLSMQVIIGIVGATLFGSLAVVAFATRKN